MPRVGSFNRLFTVFILQVLILGLVSFAAGQDAKEAKTDAADQATGSESPQGTQDKDKGAAQADPLKRPLTDKQKKQNAKSLKVELSKTYKKWLDEDVRWIITDEEQKAFKLLSNDEERDQFIEAFWQRRDPTPDTIENEFKEEHYRRMAYANEHFAAGILAGKPTEAESTLCMGRRMRLNRIRPGGLMSVPWTKGAVRLPLTRLR